MRVLSIALIALLFAVTGAQADLTKPFFNVTLDAGTWVSSKVGSAFTAYFGQPAVTVVKVNNGNDDVSNGTSSESIIFEFQDSSGQTTDHVRTESKSLGRGLSNDYSATIKSLKSHFTTQGLALHSLSVILRTTTFQFTFTQASVDKLGSNAKAHNAMDSGLLAILKKYHSPYPADKTVETLAEEVQTVGSNQVRTFQFYGKDGTYNADLVLKDMPLSAAAQGQWNTEFVNNGGLGLSGAKTIRSTVVVAPTPPPASWVANNPLILVGIIAGVVLVIIVIIVVVIHRRAKRQEVLRNTMEAMLGQEGEGEGMGERKAPPPKRAPGQNAGGKQAVAPAPAQPKKQSAAPPPTQQTAAAPPPTQQTSAGPPPPTQETTEAPAAPTQDQPTAQESTVQAATQETTEAPAAPTQEEPTVQAEQEGSA